MTTKNKKYRVYIAQVNQTYIDVSAPNEIAAQGKAYRKCRKGAGHSYVLSVEARK